MQFATALSNAENFIAQLAKEFRTEVEVDCQRSSIRLPRRLGVGDVVTYRISDSLDAFLLNGTLRSDWEITLKESDQCPVVFYTLGSGVFQRLHPGDEAKSFLLEPLQSAICAQPGKKHTKWFFGRNQEVSFLAILMHKEAFLSQIDCKTLEIPEDLLEVVKDIAGQKDFMFQEIFHLPIVTALHDILKQEDIGLLNSTFASAKLYEILFFQLQQYQLNHRGNQTSTIKPDQGLALVRNAETILITRLQEPPTIPELAKMAGINQQTLKKGFKQVYGETINQYLTTKRLEQAEILIKNGGLKLQDVALEVGYNNPSYFSRRFKEKYGVTPRYYANQIKEQQKGSRSTD